MKTSLRSCRGKARYRPFKRLILEDGCPIDRMLIVTFTNAAASEMKEKIRRAVSQSIGELAQQLSAAEERSSMPEELHALEEKLNFLKQSIFCLLMR